MQLAERGQGDLVKTDALVHCAAKRDVARAFQFPTQAVGVQRITVIDR